MSKESIKIEAVELVLGGRLQVAPLPTIFSMGTEGQVRVIINCKDLEVEKCISVIEEVSTRLLKEVPKEFVTDVVSLLKRKIVSRIKGIRKRFIKSN